MTLSKIKPMIQYPHHDIKIMKFNDDRINDFHKMSKGQFKNDVMALEVVV